MTVPLRPMSLGEILDRTIQIYRSRFLVFVGIAAIPALAMALINAANATWWRLYPPPWARPILFGVSALRALYMVATYQIDLLFVIAVWPLFASAVSKSLGNTTLKPSVAKRRWRSFAWLAMTSWAAIFLAPEVVLLGLMTGILALVFDVLKANGGDFAGPVLFFLTTIAAIFVISLWLMSRLSWAAAIWQLENRTVGQSLKRSWKLSKGTAWRVFIAWLFPAALRFISAAAVGWILMLMRSSCFDGDFIIRLKLFAFAKWSPGCMPLAIVEETRVFADMLIAALTGALFPIASTLIYYDQRIRKEGYDIERMMDAAGLNPVADSAVVVAGDSAEAEVQPG